VLEVDSAQVRTALLFAGLQASGPTRIRPAGAARDHTERLLAALGARIHAGADGLLLHPTQPEGWSAFDVDVPGDLSSAAFAIAAAACWPGSRLHVEHVGLNPGRRRMLEILQACGAGVEVVTRGASCGEPWGELHVVGAKCAALRLASSDVVRCIDEIPALLAAWAVAGLPAAVLDASELRAKESDRLSVLAAVLGAFGAPAVERADGIRLRPGRGLRPARVASHGDHRIAMAAAMLALGAPGTSEIEGVGCVRTSYPDFAADLERLAHPAHPGRLGRAARRTHSKRAARPKRPARAAPALAPLTRSAQRTARSRAASGRAGSGSARRTPGR
jgi:3-phosphoshikimate 1-carboxyvinyltransferase